MLRRKLEAPQNLSAKAPRTLQPLLSLTLRGDPLCGYMQLLQQGEKKKDRSPQRMPHSSLP